MCSGQDLRSVDCWAPDVPEATGAPVAPGSLIIVLDLLDDRDRLLDGFDRVGLLHDARLFGEQLADFDAAGVESLPVVDQPAGLAHRAVDHPQEGVKLTRLPRVM